MNASCNIRPIDDSELAAFGQVTDQAFNSNWPPEEMLRFDRMIVEPERTLVAFDGAQMVGTTLALSFGMTVPGGDVVGAAGISGVAVLPTHRRRGILSALMRRQLTTLDGGARKRLYDRVQELVAQNLPMIFLASPNVLVGANKSLGNFRPAVLDHHTLWNVEELFWRQPRPGATP